MEKSRRDQSQKILSKPISYTDIPESYNPQKNVSHKLLRENRIDKSREALNPKIAWRRHESIEKILGKENKSYLN
jgi:hypothetical protein